MGPQIIPNQLQSAVIRYAAPPHAATEQCTNTVHKV